jgi:hypothetical protein
MRHLVVVVLAACGSQPRTATPPVPRVPAPIACQLERNGDTISGLCVGAGARVGDLVVAFDENDQFAELRILSIQADPDPLMCPIFDIDAELMTGDVHRFEGANPPGIIARTPGLTPRAVPYDDVDFPKFDHAKLNIPFAIDLDGDHRADFVALDGQCVIEDKRDECITTFTRDRDGRTTPNVRFGLEQCYSERRNHSSDPDEPQTRRRPFVDSRH